MGFSSTSLCAAAAMHTFLLGHKGSFYPILLPATWISLMLLWILTSSNMSCLGRHIQQLPDSYSLHLEADVGCGKVVPCLCILKKRGEWAGRGMEGKRKETIKTVWGRGRTISHLEHKFWNWGLWDSQSWKNEVEGIKPGSSTGENVHFDQFTS